jgi:hypothetical protein
MQLLVLYSCVIVLCIGLLIWLKIDEKRDERELRQQQ